MESMHFQEIFSPYNKSEEYEKEFNNFELKEDTYSNKNENSFFYDKQLNSIEEQSFGKIDNSNNENKDDIFVCYDSIQCETPFERQEIPKPIVDNISKLANTKTKACTKTQKSILGKKTKRIEEKTVTTIKEKNQNLGRKKKEDKIKGNHTKHSEDNIMRKIKSKFLNYMNVIVNESIHDDDIKLLKLNSEINENLKRDYNMELMQTTLKKLYEESTISTKYRKQTKDDANINQKAIQRIYSLENSEKEKDVKNILDKNYIDLFNDFKNKKLNDVLIEVREEEKNKGENKEEIELYLDKFKTLCMNYEVWFSEKKGRNRSKSVQ
jgi:hypothetical protein